MTSLKKCLRQQPWGVWTWNFAQRCLSKFCTHWPNFIKKFEVVFEILKKVDQGGVVQPPPLNLRRVKNLVLKISLVKVSFKFLFSEKFCQLRWFWTMFRYQNQVLSLDFICLYVLTYGILQLWKVSMILRTSFLRYFLLKFRQNFSFLKNFVN